MRILPGVFIFSATTLCCCLSIGLSFEYDDDLRPRLLSRRAIDGTRGRKHFNPKEDNFFDDYGFEKGQYHGEKEKSGFDDLKSNVPGEPGVDYPAFVRIPRTTFSCIDRDRGYYADEEAGCQVFHVCDEGLVSTFLCPVGSLFSQRLLTCDWWSKVSCSKSREFYSLQKHAEDVPLTDHRMFHHVLSDKKEPVEVVEDQRKEQNQREERPIVVSVKKNENHLEKSHKHKHRGQHVRGQAHPKNPFLEVQNEDSPLIRIKPIVEEDRRSRIRGHSRTSTVNVQAHNRRRPHLDVSSTELPRVSTTIGNINEAITTSPLFTEGDHLSVLTTTLQNEDNTSQYAPVDVTVTKKGLDDNVTELTNPTNTGDHNSALEYDDMEGKESIGLVSSHAERKLEKEEANAVTTETSANEVTTLESVDSTTPVIVETIESTTQVDEAIQAKESIGLVHSKIQEKLQLYGQENQANVNDDSQNNAQVKTEEFVNSIDDVTERIQQYQTEASTELPNDVQHSTEATSSYTFSDGDNTEAIPTRRTQQVRKMSGFRINVAEKKTTETTTLPYDEISSSDYQELLNSSDTSFTSTILPVTVTTDEPTTIMSNNVRRISDTVEESNAPFGVMLSLNGSDEFPRTNDQIPIGVNLLGQLISQDESQPIDLTNLEIVRSDEPNQPQPQNQEQVSASMPNVRTYQHFRSHSIQQSNQQDYRNYQQQPVIATTFRNYQEQYVPTTTQVTQQNYDDYQNNQDVQNNYGYNNNEQSGNQQFVPTTTEAVPQQNYENYQSQHDKTSDFNNYEANQGHGDFTNQPYLPTTTAAPQPTSRNYLSRGNEQHNSRNNQANRNGRGNYRHPRIQNYDTTAVRSHFPDPVEPVPRGNQRDRPVNYDTYQSQPEEPTTINNYRNQPEEPPKYNTFQNQHEGPSNFDTYRRQPEEATKFTNFQHHPQIDINVNTQQSQPEEPKWDNQAKTQRNQPENSQNYVNYQTHHYPENFPDYQQNYNHQSQSSTETPQFHQKPQSNFANSQTVNYQIHTTEAPQVYHRPQQNIDNSPNYTPQQNIQNLQSTRNHQPTLNAQNYDYPNYESVEDIAENSNYGEFGVRISAKNPNSNILKVNTKRPKITEDSNDAHTINAGLQGKAANFLWAMSQLAKTDRLPRPFAQSKNNADDSFSRHRNTHYRNHVPDDKPRQKINNIRPVSTVVNNYNVDHNNNQQYSVDVDDFAAPRFENTQSTFQKNNQQLDVPRQERILNSASPVPEIPLIPILLSAPEPQFNPYNIQNIPELNTVPFDIRNSQFVQVSAPDLSQYNVENTSVPSGNDQILRDPQAQSVDYSDYQQHTQIPDVQNEPQPQPIDFNYQSTTQQTVQDGRVPQRNVEIVQDIQDFRPTAPPTEEIVKTNEEQTRYSSFNSTQETVKTSVETEFIPSLSFDFGSDEGRKEYLEALEKGLVPNDSNARRIDGDVSSSDSASVAVEKMDEEQVHETTTSDIMDNFKDTGAVMSGME